MARYLIQVKGPAPDNKFRGELAAAGAPIVADVITQWGNDPATAQQHDCTVQIEAETEDGAVQKAKDAFGDKPYSGFTVAQRLD